jgi:hypothetical protein
MELLAFLFLALQSILLVNLYGLPAVLIRYIFLGRPTKQWTAVILSFVLFFTLSAINIFLSGLTAHSPTTNSVGADMAYRVHIGNHVGFILIASVWSFFILKTKNNDPKPLAQIWSYFISRAKSREPQSSAPTSSPHLWPKASPDSVESKPKEVVKTITEPAKKPASRPAENPKKKEPVEKEKSQMSKAHNDEKFFKQVAAELEEGNRKKGLWLKAETKAKGDADRARLLYVEWRVEQLAEAEDEARRQKEEAELEVQREEEERQRLAEEERQRLTEEERQRLAEEEKEERQRLAEEKKRSELIQPVTTLKEANECIAPLVRHGYSVELEVLTMGMSSETIRWKVIDRNGKSQPVAQSKLKLYVYDQIKLHGYDTTIQSCEKCGGPMEELGKGVWHCNDCR